MRQPPTLYTLQPPHTYMHRYWEVITFLSKCLSRCLCHLTAQSFTKAFAFSIGWDARGVCKIFTKCRKVQVQARQTGGNQQTVSQAFNELLWRDYFKLLTKKDASLSLAKQHSAGGSAATRQGTGMHAPQAVAYA